MNVYAVYCREGSCWEWEADVCACMRSFTLVSIAGMICNLTTTGCQRATHRTLGVSGSKHLQYHSLAFKANSTLPLHSLLTPETAKYLIAYVTSVFTATKLVAVIISN